MSPPWELHLAKWNEIFVTSLQVSLQLWKLSLWLFQYFPPGKGRISGYENKEIRMERNVISFFFSFVTDFLQSKGFSPWFNLSIFLIHEGHWKPCIRCSYYISVVAPVSKFNFAWAVLNVQFLVVPIDCWCAMLSPLFFLVGWNFGCCGHYWPIVTFMNLYSALCFDLIWPSSSRSFYVLLRYVVFI
jgi:hypothetical protein